MFIQNFSKREKIAMFVTVGIAAAAFLYNFIFEPIGKRWAQLNSEIAAKSQTLRKDSKLLNMRSALSADYAKLSKYARSTKKDEEEMAAILTELEAVSRSAGCLIVNVNPRGIRNLGAYKEALVDVTTESGMNEFAKFLYSIETSKSMILKVKRFTLSSKSIQEKILRSTLLISKVLIE